MIEITEIRPAAGGDPIPADVVILDYEDRWVRRKVLEAAHGDRLKIDLPELRALQDRERIITRGGTHYEVIAAEEYLIEITGSTLPRIAWHVGNRHTPCQVEDNRLLIRRDHVLKDMLTKLGAEVRDVNEPFQPEGGAYGHGRTHGHSHSHDPQAPVAKRAGFMYKHFWATQFDRNQLYPAGWYPNQSKGGDGLSEWVEADRPLVNEDVVVWYTMNLHHLPRPEDWPVQPVVYANFHWMPDGFFDENPALDVPPNKGF